MSISKNPFSLYFPVKLGCLKLLAFIDENLHVEDDECLSKPHSHHIYELRYIESGECTQILNGIPLILAEQNVILVKPDEYHYQKNIDPNNQNSQFSIRFQIENTPAVSAPHQSRALKNLREILDSVRFVKDEKNALTYLFHRIEYEITKKPDGYIQNLQFLTSLIITEFIRYSKKNIKAIFPPEDVKYRGLMFTKLEQFFSWKYSDNTIKIQDLANDIKLSKRHTARILQQVYGMSFSGKLNEVRIQQATYQLIYSDLKIEEISKNCGFSNSSYFFMQFKKSHGVTPAIFRQKNNLEVSTPKKDFTDCESEDNKC